MSKDFFPQFVAWYHTQCNNCDVINNDRHFAELLKTVADIYQIVKIVPMEGNGTEITNYTQHDQETSDRYIYTE